MQHITAEFLRSGTYTLLSASCSAHSAEQNDRATARLYFWLSERGCDPVVAQDVHNGAIEALFLVPEMSQGVALRAGRLFRQPSIFLAAAGSAKRISCETGESVAVFSTCKVGCREGSRVEVYSERHVWCFEWSN